MSAEDEYDESIEVDSSPTVATKLNQYSLYRDVPEEKRLMLENSAKRISRQGKLNIMTKKRIASLKASIASHLACSFIDTRVCAVLEEYS